MKDVGKKKYHFCPHHNSATSPGVIHLLSKCDQIDSNKDKPAIDKAICHSRRRCRQSSMRQVTHRPKRTNRARPKHCGILAYLLAMCRVAPKLELPLTRPVLLVLGGRGLGRRRAGMDNMWVDCQVCYEGRPADQRVDQMEEAQQARNDRRSGNIRRWVFVSMS